MIMSTDTIAAIGTALSNSGISIIRVSGSKSLNIINKIFLTSSEIKPNNIVYGKIVKNKKIIDFVLVSYFKSPKSYTGEDICEINCHGGNEVTKEILEIVLENGARLAEPGEFSKRAFLNGKMDLTKAEAIINLINSKSNVEARIASNNLGGDLYNKIKTLRNDLIELLAHIEVSIDYPEYDYEKVENNAVNELLKKEIFEINKIVNTYEQGKYISNGINVTILGKPNVGKSSLLNLLSKSEKAIVTDIPGTTRDIIEEKINIGNMILNVSDTAGLRETEDIIEKIGVEKSIKKIDETDLVIYMLNAENKVDKKDIEILSNIQKKNIKTIVIINKTDKVEDKTIKIITNELKNNNIENIISTSIVNLIGIEELKNKIEKLIFNNDFDFEDQIVITNIRHKNLLKKSLEYVNHA